MEISALYHRPDSEMAYLKTKDAFQIRLRTKHSDVKEVKLLYRAHADAAKCGAP